MRITYEVSDGYVGGSAPHYVDIDDDLLDECDNEDEREELINEIVQNDFEQNISWTITDRG